jgi:hypothetical protein
LENGKDWVFRRFDFDARDRNILRTELKAC